MKSQSHLGHVKKRWLISAALALIAIVVCGVFVFNDSGGRQNGLWGEDTESQVASLNRPVREKSADGGEDREWISDEEYARRAAASPDQAPVNKRFVSPPAGKSDLGGLTWETIGPAPFTGEYWSGDDICSGRVSAILVDPIDPDIAYIAAAQGGVWKTTDAGASWTPMTDGLSSLASGALAFDPYDSDMIYYGTGEHHFSSDSFYGDGLFFSDDAGVSWTKIALKADVGSYISRVVIDIDDPDIIYVASDRGFVRSTDAGVNWTVELGPGHCTDIAMDPAGFGVVYCAFSYSGVWKSTNYGDNWSKLDNGMPTDGFKRINMAMAPTDPSVIYAAFAKTDGHLYGMYKTTNAGANWSLLLAPDYLGGQGNYDNCIIVDPQDEDVCYAGGNFPFGGVGDYGLVKTTDGGASWNDINIGVDGSQPHPDHHIFAWGSDGRLWLGNDGGVWNTDDGGLHWNNCNSNLSLAQFYTNAIHPTNPNFLLGGTQDNGAVRFDGTMSWPQVSPGDGGPCAVEWDSPNIYYVTYTRMSSLYKYDDGVYQGNFVGPWDSDRASWCNAPLVVDQNQANTLLTGTHRVWRTTTSGDSWTDISGDLTNGGYLRAVEVATGASNTIYTGSSDGLVHVTTDATTWTPRSTGLPAAPVTDIAIDPEYWDTAYLSIDDPTAGDCVFFTEDAGVNWIGITGDLPLGLRALSMAADFRTYPPRLYLGTDYGLYTSFDDGWTWIKSDANMPSLAIYDIKVDPVNSLLIAGTHGRGMYRAPLDVTEPVVTLTSPNGAEILAIGNDYDITWTANDDTEVTSVSLFLSRDSGFSYTEDIAIEIANTGSYTWTATGPVSPNCRIEVVAEDGSMNIASVESAEDFIVQGTSPVDQDIPFVTALNDAHPNPFNPKTTISFDLGKDTHAQLQVYSIDGKLIKTLVNESLPAGPHSAVWDGTDVNGRSVATGNYLYSLSTAEGFRQSGKMLLMK